MIVNGGYNSGGSSKKVYLYATTRYIGSYKYTYMWYEQNGVKRMETKKEYIAPPRKQASAKTKAVVKKTPLKTKPASVTSSQQKKTAQKAVAKKKTVPKKPSTPGKVTKPKFTQAKAAAVGKFSFTKKAPVRKQVTVPQPPPAPGPKPSFAGLKQEAVTRYEYLYGIKNIELKHTQYQSKSVYISKPINAEGNVMQVSLRAVEEHPLFDALSGAAADRQTSVEYYVAPVGMNPNPALDEWLPILPEDVATVKSELLMFGTARTAELRFPARIGSAQTPVVYRNGLALKKGQWSFIEGGTGMRLLVEKDPTAIYTIDYTPNAEFYNPWRLDVNQQAARPVRHTQLFEQGTNHNKTVVLDKYPYVNYEVINTTDAYDANLSDYVPIRVRLQDAGIIGPNRIHFKDVAPLDGTSQYVFTKNITNYKTGHSEALKPYSIDPDSLYNGFEYRQEGNKLYFSETFNKADAHMNEQESHGNAKIAVEYEYLSSDFRVKIILRRNSTDENTLTPIVHEYTLKFKVMK